MSEIRKTPLQSLKGMEDILPSEVSLWQEVERRFREVFQSFNFEEIRTPVLEPIELFKRSIGEETDIVAKEMFAFKDRGDRDLALRPEMTASVVRSLIQHRLWERAKNFGLFYWGPMYRAERPQKGRKREFYQAGCELFGTSHPYQDVLLITLLVSLLKSIGLEKYELKINHLGTLEERKKYFEVLKSYLESYRASLSPDSQKRLETNILRIFDSKIENDLRITEGAPKLLDFLGEKSQGELNVIEAELKKLGIAYRLEPRIVRGLDYYSGFVFEAVHPSLGAQDAIGGGGRYDQLVENLGGPALGASGFSLGIERILMSLEGDGQSLLNIKPLVYFASLSPDYFGALHSLRCRIAALGFRTEANSLEPSLKKQLAQASKLSAQVTVILGEDEMKKDIVLMKDMTTGTQKETAFDKIEETLREMMGK